MKLERDREYYITVECISPKFTSKVIKKSEQYGLSTFLGITNTVNDDIVCIHAAQDLSKNFQSTDECSGIERFNSKYFPHLSNEFTFNDDTANSMTLPARAISVELNFIVQKITFNDDSNLLCQISVCERPSPASVEEFFESQQENHYSKDNVSFKKFLN